MFKQAVVNQSDRTLNGMKALVTSGSASLDLFFKGGASRGQDITPTFAAALAEDVDLAMRIALWIRDVRGGAGERQIFRDILIYMERHNRSLAVALMNKAPYLGRWDDILVVKTPELWNHAVYMVKRALTLAPYDALCAKWMPRKGPIAVRLTKSLGLSPKAYRKLIVERTSVVETQMCAKEWSDINYSQVPSIAAARYRKAFYRNDTERFSQYVEALKNGDSSVKVNAGAIFPHEVIKDFLYKLQLQNTFSSTEREFIVSQWNALPNHIGDSSILPMVDVSGSMNEVIGSGKGTSLRCIDVAVGLGLYVADKNTGAFKDLVLTFSTQPELLHLKGDVVLKCDQLRNAHWSMSTNLHAAFDKVLQVAKEHSVPQAEMPEVLLILSDMQFDECISFDDRAYTMIKRKYEEAGYNAPKIVFWNIKAYSNVPVSFNETGVALISGFSPAILKAVLSGGTENFTAQSIMLQTVMDSRYDWQ